jgi:hypothetical protein
MCFNGAKTYQLGWYSQYHVNLPSSGSFNWNGYLVGFAEKSSASSSDKMIVRIVTSTADTYVHFNRKIGMNSGTQEGGDQVLVTTRNTGTGYAESNLVSKMSTGSVYTIPNFNGSPNSLVIRVVLISTSTVPGRANISIQFGGSVPTRPTWKPNPSPTPQPTPIPTLEPIAFTSSPVSPAPVASPQFTPVVVPTPFPTPPPTPPPTPAPTKRSTSKSKCNFNKKCETGEDCGSCPSDCNWKQNVFCCVGGNQCNKFWCNQNGRSCGR